MARGQEVNQLNTLSALCEKTLAALAGLSVFSGLREKPAARAFENLLAEAAKKEIDHLKLLKAWAAWIQLYAAVNQGESFWAYWKELAQNDENIFSLSAERGELQAQSLLASLAENDLQRISFIAAFDLNSFTKHISSVLNDAGLAEAASLILKDGAALLSPSHNKSTPDINAFELAAFFQKHGAGSFSACNFFHWKHGGLVPAKNGDTITLDELTGYEAQRNIVIDNTLRFLDGKHEANNILLYGDRGTGKSATVKALCNTYSARGLRLVELNKQDMNDLPLVLSSLSLRGLYFILFVDDLSFESQNDSFNTLKALLEGGIEAKPKNVVVYATSNRRHLVKEKSNDRPDSAAAATSLETGDMRAFDTMQEQFSLAERFGVTVVFAAPSQDEYLKIAEFLAKTRGVLDKNTGAGELKIFFDNALKWERWFNGRSPRTARQYVDWLSGGSGFPWE
jgi:predicted AAA+ superfamily ATPase